MIPVKTIIWQSLLATALTGLLSAGGWVQAMMGQARGVTRPWQIVTSPNATIVSNQLLGVAALSPHDIWAVGLSNAPTQVPPTQALIEHFDGTSWSIVPSPSVTDATGSFLQAVAGVSPRDVWAVGSSSTPNIGSTRTLVEHFDGARWQVVASPNAASATGQNVLSGVVALSPRNVWAVGSFRDTGGSALRTLIEHFDGTRWNIVPSPNVGLEENVLNGVSAVAPHDIWAVGRSGTATVEYRTLVEHFDGTQWSVVPSANIPERGNNLDAVAAASPHNVWAVGYQVPSEAEDKPLQTLIEHYDGRSWSVIPSPNASTGDNILWGVAIASPRNIWAVGYSLQTLIEHYDGRSWTIVPSPNVTNGANVFNKLLGVVALSAQNTWAVGFTYRFVIEGTTSQTLIEHQAP